MASTISGMAASIRSATESVTFDMAGHDASSIGQIVRDAFGMPFSHLNDNDRGGRMIRITFVVGAGKLSRQKYDSSAMQALTLALKALDYVEDRAASCLIECGGCYKTQHDTGKNLYTVVVFPRSVGADGNGDDDCAKEGGGAGGGVGSSSSSSSSSYPIPMPLVEGTAAHTILLSSEDAFKKSVPYMCPSWSEKRMCSEVLHFAIESVSAIDDKLISGMALSDIEQSFYDAVGGKTSIDAKVECTRRLMAEQVESGPMTRREIDLLLRQVGEKIARFDTDIDAAMRDSMEGRAATLTAQRERAEARRVMLMGRVASSPHPLKHESRISELRRRLMPLLELERSTKGRLLSIKETRELAARDELVSEICELEGSSRGLFEEDDAFEERLAVSRGKKQSSSTTGGGGTAKAAPGKGRVRKSGTGTRGGAAWQTPGLAAPGCKNAAAVKSKPRPGGGVFAAMMIDSDSDSD